MRRLMVALLLLSVSCQPTYANDKDTDAITEYVRHHEHRLLKEFERLLAIPNNAAEIEHIRMNARMIVEMMRVRGLKPRLLQAKDPKAPPAIYGERNTPGAHRTLVFYAHYDGQPADAHHWIGGQPWRPVLRSSTIESGGTILRQPTADERINGEWRLYARSAADDKAGVVAILSALDALEATSVRPDCNVKLFFEGEEEAGSPHLEEILSSNKTLLIADAWIICDGPVHPSGRKQIAFGVRGDVNVDLTVFGANRPLHSGHYGNWAPNPALLLAKLLASMKNDSGQVVIDGWYDDVEPLGEAEKRALAEAPQEDEFLRANLGIAQTEGNGRSLLELINQPSLNINGIGSADIGALARNVIPMTATTVLDLRLVKGNDYGRQVQRLIAHIRQQGFFVIDREPSQTERLTYKLIAKVIQRPGAYNAERTDMGLPVSLDVIEAVQSVSDKPIVKLPSLGGSLPLSLFREVLNAPTIIVPIANYDNNQHAENENIRLQNLWDGIEIMAAIMSRQQRFEEQGTAPRAVVFSTKR